MRHRKVSLLADVWFDILKQTFYFLPHSFSNRLRGCVEVS